MNSQKVCESAYLTANDPVRGPYMHGAAMVDRSGPETHIWLVRGKCTDSVVGELHNQLVRSGRVQGRRFRRSGLAAPSALVLIGAIFAVGLSLLLGLGSGR